VARSALLDAAVLGGVSGLRTFTAPAALALRGRLAAGSRPRTALLVIAGGELVADKLPIVPSRTAPGPLFGRAVAGAVVGSAAAGPVGAGVGAAAAVSASYAGTAARARTSLPNVVAGLVEDAVAIGAAAWASRAG
jgi:uncharacterized membrane protein